MSSDGMGTTTRRLQRVWQVLGSTQLAAFLLGLVLLVSAFASLFPQMPNGTSIQGLWNSAVTLRFGPIAGLLSRLSLFNAFQSPWYLLLLAALLLNACICTLQRLPRRDRSLTAPSIVARAGTFLTHLGLPLLLLAILARPILFWQETATGLLPGEPYALKGRPDLAMQTGHLNVDLHPGGHPRGYAVPLTVHLGQAPMVTDWVHLNHPLAFRRLAFHLQGYGPAARLQTPESSYSVAFRDSQMQEVFVAELMLNLRLAYQPEGEAMSVEVIDDTGTLLGAGLVRDGQTIEIQSTPVVFSLTHYTDWQVSQDPTFALALIGAGMVLTGSMISLWLPHRSLWLRLGDQKPEIAGIGTSGDESEALAGKVARTSAPASRPTGKKMPKASSDPGDTNG